MRCYVASPGEKADRIARADSCFLTADGAHVLSEKRNRNNELTLTVTDLDGSNEITLLDDVAASRTQVSSDFSHVAYLNQSEDGQSVILLDDAGENLFASNEYEAITSFGFWGDTDTLYFVGVNEDGEHELRTSAEDGALVEAPAMAVMPTAAGASLAVLTIDKDSSSKLSVLNLGSSELIEVVSGENLWMSLISDPPRLLALDDTDDELMLIVAEPSGKNPVTLFDDNDYGLLGIIHSPSYDRVLLRLGSEGRSNLYVAYLDGSPGHFILKDWSQFQVINLSTDTLLLSGREDETDDLALYAATLTADADLIELDDSADAYGYGIIVPDGRVALYNATVGDNLDDIVVRQVRLDGEEPPEDLYEGMLLVATSWAEIDPFNSQNQLYWQNALGFTEQSGSIDVNELTVAEAFEEMMPMVESVIGEVVSDRSDIGSSAAATEINVTLGQVAGGDRLAFIFNSILTPLTTRITIEYELRNETNGTYYFQSGYLPVEFLDASGYTIPVERSIYSISANLMLPVGFKVMDASIYEVKGGHSSHDITQMRVPAEITGGAEIVVDLTKTGSEKLESLEEQLPLTSWSQYGDLKVIFTSIEGDYQFGLENLGDEEVVVTFGNFIFLKPQGGDLNLNVIFFDATGLACPPDTTDIGRIIIPPGSSVRQSIPTRSCQSALGTGLKLLMWKDAQTAVFFG
jgi:hypothetical protein